MVKKKKTGLALALFWRNSVLSFCAMLPQVLNTNYPLLSLNHLVHRGKILKRMNLGVFTLFHFHLLMISGVHQLMRLLGVCKFYYQFSPNLNPMIAPHQLVEAAGSWIAKLSLKKDSGYPIDSNPNPGNVCFYLFFLIISMYLNLALAYHNMQLEAAAFREELDPESFEDLTLPNYKAMHKVTVIVEISISSNPDLTSALVFFSRHGEILLILMNHHILLFQPLVPSGRWLVKCFQLVFSWPIMT